jgi:hypothetical protein
MELIFLAAVIILSILLALGGTRAILWVILLVVMRTPPDHPDHSVGHVIPDSGASEAHPAA